MSPTERRENPRVRFPVPMKYRLMGEFLEMWRDGMLLDLSAGGLRFTSQQAIELGDTLELQLVLPIRRDAYFLLAKTVWERESAVTVEHGVAFIQVTPDKQVEIGELVRFLSQPPSTGAP